jgi:hypothetical protein
MRLLPIFVAALLAGCSTTDGLAPSVSHAGYDGARVVDIRPHGTASCTSMPCASIGAQWSSAHPDRATLYVRMTGATYTGITGAKLSADGDERVFKSAILTRFDPGVGPVHRSSTQPFPVDLAFLRKVAQAKRSWLRVQTVEGYSDFAVIDGAEDSKALHAMRRFLALVDEQK